jgi:bifunctional non-homologous end joining protein LigD
MDGRILFPSTGFTTEDLCATYEQLAPVLLPHLRDRPVTLKRYPDDVQGEAFWEKDAPAFAPKWVRTFAVPRKHEPGVIRYISIPDVKTLRWAASVGCIEIHSFLHRYPYVSSPTVIAFDLDPGKGATIIDCCQVGVLVREWFGRHDLRSFAKVSGSKGLQV